jgi:hypothetical protein
MQVVAGAYKFYIIQGKDGTEQMLILALSQYGDTSMASVFLNCGNAELEKAAEDWAYDHGYIVQAGGGSGTGAQWGE